MEFPGFQVLNFTFTTRGCENNDDHRCSLRQYKRELKIRNRTAPTSCETMSRRRDSKYLPTIARVTRQASTARVATDDHRVSFDLLKYNDGIEAPAPSGVDDQSAWPTTNKHHNTSTYRKLFSFLWFKRLTVLGFIIIVIIFAHMMQS